MSLWIRTGSVKRAVIFFVLITILISVSFPLFGSNIEVVGVVEKNNLSVGESFIYQIQIQGSDIASDYPKDIWDDSVFNSNFNVEFLGAQNNSSRQISIINGRRKEIINTAYIISYSLTPLKTGVLTIPSVLVTIEGEKYTTRSIPIESKEAEESNNLKLIVTLDKNRAYVGEPLQITFTWYIGMNINDFVYSVPFFNDSNFSFIDSEGLNPDPSSLVRFPIDGIVVNAAQGKGTLKGKSYTTVTFSKLVTPKISGTFSIPKSIISVSAQVSGSGRGNDLFSSFFSSVSREYKQFSVPSNNLSLKVLALPDLGKPDNFDGYIGELHVETSAIPLEVRVGDPITFTMQISGPKNISDWNPPDLNKQYELASNFKMPSEISAGKIEGNSVIFTQTLRSLNDSVTQIPALEIPYFDTFKGVYSIAKSEAIPISVAKGSSVKVEGSGISNSSNLQQEIIQTNKNGINFNYDDVKILENQSFGLKILNKFPLNLLIIIPPLIFFVILIIRISKNRFVFSNISSKKITFSDLTREMKEIQLKAFSEESGALVKKLFIKFLAYKMLLPGNSISEKDVTGWLKNKNMNITDFPMILEVFSLLDEIQYGGFRIAGKDQKRQLENLIAKVLLAVEDMEGRITK